MEDNQIQVRRKRVALIVNFIKFEKKKQAFIFRAERGVLYHQEVNKGVIRNIWTRTDYRRKFGSSLSATMYRGMCTILDACL